MQDFLFLFFNLDMCIFTSFAMILKTGGEKTQVIFKFNKEWDIVLFLSHFTLVLVNKTASSIDIICNLSFFHPFVLMPWF